jgi:hypothetical protein
MYFFFAPALIAVPAILFIHLKEQWGEKKRS